MPASFLTTAGTLTAAGQSVTRTYGVIGPASPSAYAMIDGPAAAQVAFECSVDGVVWSPLAAARVGEAGGGDLGTITLGTTARQLWSFVGLHDQQVRVRCVAVTGTVNVTLGLSLASPATLLVRYGVGAGSRRLPPCLRSTQSSGVSQAALS